MKNTYVVYLNKTYDVWARDAHEWAKKNNLPTDNIISQVAFWRLLDQGVLEGAPVYFCKDIQDDRQPWIDNITNFSSNS